MGWGEMISTIWVKNFIISPWSVRQWVRLSFCGLVAHLLLSGTSEINRKKKQTETNRGVLHEIYLVVSTHLKNISQIGSFPQAGVKIKKMKPPLRKQLLKSYLHLYGCPIRSFGITRTLLPRSGSWLGATALETGTYCRIAHPNRIYRNHCDGTIDG